MLFKVIGNRTVAEVAPGGTIELDEDDPRTAALVTAKHLTPAKRKPAAKPDTEEGDR